MKHRIEITIVYIIFCVVACYVQGQTVQRFRINPQNLGVNVHLIRYSDQQQLQFENVLSLSPEISSLKPMAFILDNQTDKPIIAVAARWKIATLQGEQTVFNSHTHSYLIPGAAPIVTAHEQMFIAPNVFIPSSSLKPGAGLMGVIPSQRILGLFNKAADVTLTLDSIVFADGETVGPNNLNVVGEINDYMEAVSLVIESIRAARQNGDDAKERLKKDSDESGFSSNGVKRQHARLVSNLLTTAHFSQVFSALESLPPPPRFHRPDGSSL